MSIINKLFGRPAALKETLFEDIQSVLESTKQKSFAIEYTLDTNVRIVMVFNRSRNVALIYNSEKPLNIEERLEWSSDSIHPDMIDKAKEVSQDIDTNRYMSFVHRFGHTGDFIDYINVIYRDYSMQSLVELQKVFPDNVLKRNVVGLNSVDTEKFDFLDLSLEKLEKRLTRRRQRYETTLETYGLLEDELSNFLLYSAEGIEKNEDIEKIINYATIEKLSFEDLYEVSNGFMWWDIVEAALIFAARGDVEIVDSRTRQFVELFDVKQVVLEQQLYVEANADQEAIQANFEQMLQEVNEVAESVEGDSVNEDLEEDVVNSTFNVLANMNDIETVDSDLIDDSEEEHFWDYEESYGEEISSETSIEELDEGDYFDDIDSKDITLILEEDSSDELNETDLYNKEGDYFGKEENSNEFLEYTDIENNDVELDDFIEIEFQDELDEELLSEEINAKYDTFIDEEEYFEDGDIDDLEYEDDEEVDFIHDVYGTEDDTLESAEEESLTQERSVRETDEQAEKVYQAATSAFTALEDKLYDEKFEQHSDVSIEEDFEYIVDAQNDYEDDEDGSFEYVSVDEEFEEDEDSALDYEDELAEQEDSEPEKQEFDTGNSDEFDSSRTIRLPDLNNLFDDDGISAVSTIDSDEDLDFISTVVSPENTLKLLGVESNDFSNKFKDLIKEKRNAEERLAVLPKLVEKCNKESEELEVQLRETEDKIDEIQEDVTRKKAIMEAAIEDFNKSSEQLDTYSAKGVEYRQQIKRIFENVEGFETEEQFYTSVRDSAKELIGRAVNETPETVSSFSEILDSMQSRRVKSTRPKQQEGLVTLNDITQQIPEANPIEVYENEGGGVLKEGSLEKEPEDRD